MGNTTSTKTTDERTLPQRNTTSGRFEKTMSKPSTSAKPVAAKPATTAKPAAKKTKKS